MTGALFKLTVIILISLMGIAGQVLIKKGLNEIGPFEMSGLLRHSWSLLTNVPILTGICLLAASMILYFPLLSQNELSSLYPISVGINFILIALSSFLALGEGISALKTSGLALILAGITCLFCVKS